MTMKTTMKIKKNRIATGIAALAVAMMTAAPLTAQSFGPSQGTASTKDAAPGLPELDKIVARFEASSEEVDPKLYRELRDLLLTTPGLTGEIPGILRSGDVSLDTSANLIFSLEDIGSDAAQDALVEIQVDRQQRYMDRLRAVVSLGAVEYPTDAALNSLWATADRRFEPQDMEFSNTALLSLGVAGSVMRFKSSSDYDQLRDGLLDRLLSTTDALDRSVTLKAIGNLHDPALGNEVATFLFDRAATVRVSAATALGMMHDESKRAVLAGLLEVEPRGVVRNELTEALRQMPADDSSLRAVLVLVENERNHEARASMVSYLLEHLHEFEEARVTLHRMTFNDPTNRIRMLASASLRN